MTDTRTNHHFLCDAKSTEILVCATFISFLSFTPSYIHSIVLVRLCNSFHQSQKKARKKWNDFTKHSLTHNVTKRLEKVEMVRRRLTAKKITIDFTKIQTLNLSLSLLRIWVLEEERWRSYKTNEECINLMGSSCLTEKQMLYTIIIM